MAEPAPPGFGDVAPFVLEHAWSAPGRGGYWYGLSLPDLAALASTCRGLRQAVDTFAGRQTALDSRRFQDYQRQSHGIKINQSPNPWMRKRLDGALEWVSRKMPALRALDLAQTEGDPKLMFLDDRGLAAVATLAHLENLTLSNSASRTHEITTGGVAKVIQRCPLVELHLAFAFHPAGLNFDQICWLLGNHCSTTLKVLEINGTLFEDEDDDDFGITATGFGQLKRLRLERLVVWANDGTPCNVQL